MSVYIRKLTKQDATSSHQLLLRNREMLRPFQPIRSESSNTLDAHYTMIQNLERNWQADRAYGFGIFLKDSEQLIGRVNLDNVSRGAWQNCTIGYHLDQEYHGRGYMTEAVRLAVNYAFHNLKLHRVQAAVMPHNLASHRVLEKVGFQKEGFSPKYLQINGVWEDHVLYAITVENWI
ncbi:GNAT family N-acetyltransferase [Risungbinella massiliensis]|uniref:GNAT family N-acetyltransferase n=1 Tax=Risungbinella massiliensis TaxID=1329796 RepID=UPI0005CBE8BF|nr:GNAT family protein [Risungbinella massiliensis]